MLKSSIPFIVFFVTSSLFGCSGSAQEASSATAASSGSIVGTWKVRSYELEFQDTGERVAPPLGLHPNGYAIFTLDGRAMFYLEALERKVPTTVEEQAAAYRTLIAYTGRYQVEGNKWIARVDGAWNVAWVGSEQERTFSISGDQMTTITQWNSNPLYDGRMTRGHLVSEREK